MSTFAEIGCVEVHSMGIGQYRAIYQPWAVRPMRTYEGISPLRRNMRTGLRELRYRRSEITQIHLLDVVANTGFGSMSLSGIRVYGQGNKLLMSFPDLTLFGDAEAVSTTYDLLRSIGMNLRAIDGLYEAARCQNHQRVDGSGIESYNYILVAILNG